MVANCKACSAWFGTVAPQDLCPTCERTLERMKGYATPVVHGRWLDGAEDFTCGNHNAECSICHCYVSWSGCDEDFNYCPNCGARMDEGDR